MYNKVLYTMLYNLISYITIHLLRIIAVLKNIKARLLSKSN